MGLKFGRGAVLAALLSQTLFVASAQAQDWRSTYTIYGTPGLIEMPTALGAPDAELSFQISDWARDRRSTLSFQISPRLSGSFRYSRIEQRSGPGTEDTFDRSFDLRYRLTDEGTYMPALAIGLQDFMGTGLYSSEYIAATKTFDNKFALTMGLGWGRLGSLNPIAAPLGARPDRDFGEGGKPSYNDWFRGDMAVFGGAEYRLNDRITAKVEYSSDAYARQTDNGSYERASPLNFGVTYQPRPGYELSLNYLYGNEIAFAATLVSNPRLRPVPSGFDPAPIPVAVRAQDLRAAATWDRAALPEASLTALLSQALATEGIDVQAVHYTDRSIRLRYDNGRYRSEAQALGRISRILTQALPPSIETFILEPSSQGIAVSAVTLQRSDIEAYENAPGGTENMRQSVDVVATSQQSGMTTVPSTKPRLDWGLAPYLELSLFDRDEPVRTDYGLRLNGTYQISPTILASGAVRARFGGSFGDGLLSDSVIQHVRSDGPLYVQGNFGLEHLTLAAYGHPAPDIYTRATIGYLEPMFAGVSGEVLWAPMGKRYALGAELNYVAQRDFEMGFGVQDYTVAMGHVSGHYQFDNGFHAQVDVGRFLAGDLGATFAVDREFANGWKVGAYFTLTDVPFEDYGEGSFDKGIRITIPMDWMTGSPTTASRNTVINSLSRDGGAKLNVDGRLYDVVRGGHVGDLSDSFGRFWR